MLAGLAAQRDSIWLATTNSTASEPVLFDFDAVYLTPEVARQPDAYAARFRDLLSDFEPDLVIPCRDDDVSFLADERLRHKAMAPRFLCGDAMVAAAMLDKLESARFSAQHGLPFAPKVEVSSDAEAANLFASTHGFPLIAKPRRGFASRGVRLILNAQQLQ